MLTERKPVAKADGTIGRHTKIIIQLTTLVKTCICPVPTVWFSAECFRHVVCLNISWRVFLSIAVTALSLEKFKKVSVSPRLHFHKQELVANRI